MKLTRSGDRHQIRMERRFAHPRGRVWRALTSPDELTHWFPADVTFGDERALTFTFRDAEAPPSGGEVRACEPEHLFEFSWQGEILRWELAPDGPGCLLTFTHTFDDGPGAASFATGWTSCLDTLDATLSGTTAPAGWSAQLHDRLLDDFGLRDGVTEALPGGGWRVRFVRQLTQPVDVVRTILDGRPPAAGDWQLTPGPGGARATVTVTGSGTSIDEAYADARRALDALAATVTSYSRGPA
ncbi:SRPBCC family protein [Cryptosporangium phraense]|nr:SRPBCC family protein [Cryptosporangium phraense]